MSVWPIPIEAAINLATFVCFPLSLLLMIAVALLPSQTDRLAFWALALANGTLCYAVFATFNAIDDRLHIGAWIARLALAAYAGAFLAGLVCFLARHRRDTPPTTSARVVTSLAIGLGFPLVLLFWIAPFARWPGITVFTLLGAVAVAGFHQAMAAWPPESVRGLYRTASGTLAACLIVSIGIGLLTASQVARAAREAAAGRAYYIHPAGGFLDLSILTLREPRTGHRRPAYDEDHGLLVIEDGSGPKLLSWSYRESAFRPGHTPGGVAHPLSELCRPH